MFKSMIHAIGDWIGSRDTREQWLLVSALPFTLLLVLLILLFNLVDYRNTAQQAYRQQLQHYQWLRTDTRALRQWQQDFSDRSLGLMRDASEFGQLLSRQLEHFGINATVSEKKDGKSIQWHVDLQSNPGNLVFVFIEAAIGSGADPVQIKLSNIDKKGLVQGLIVFEILQ